MQPYEFVVTLIIADLATVPMSDTALPLLHGVIPLLALVCLHFIFTLLEKKSLAMRKLLNGKPVILIDPNGVNYKNLKMCNMNFNDLQEGLRSAGYFHLDEILYAIIQTNGTISVLPKSAYAPLTATTAKIEADPASLPIIIVAEGNTVKENINIAKINEEFILTCIKKENIKNIKDILLMTIDTQGKIFLQEYNKSATTINVNYNGDW